MNPAESSVTLQMPRVWLWVLRVGGGVLGFLLGLLVKSLVQWLDETIGGAPGPLRLLAALPLWWAVTVLTVVGALAGIWLSHRAQQESLVVTVDRTSIRLQREGYDRYIPREAIAAVFLDGKFLVFLDRDTKQIVRVEATDVPARDIQAACERFGYPWRGTRDPHEDEFQRWIDGHPALDEQRNRLLRARARALSEGRTGTAEEIAEQLQDVGIVVRDRDGVQQYRRIT